MQHSYIQTIQKETEQTLRKLETTEAPVISKALTISLYLEKVFEKLKQVVSCHTFSTEQEEIEFFKDVKPRIFCKLIYYRKIYNIEMNRPVSGPDAVRSYLNRELDNIQDYNHKRLDFYRYYRSGATHLDKILFCEMSGMTQNNILTAFILNGILCFRHVAISVWLKYLPAIC